jgi:RNA polymerase sigma factor (TIGR02999 family)
MHVNSILVAAFPVSAPFYGDREVLPGTEVKSKVPSRPVPMSEPGEITQLLRRAAAGDAKAESRLIETLYSELRQIAAGFMRRERSDHTLQPTALVNEAYLRLLGQRGIAWQDRGHFFSLAARVMRRILLDSARARGALKRGGKACHQVDLEEGHRSTVEPGEKLLDLDAALQRLSTIDPKQARIVELRFFAGMTEGEIAEVLGISERTVKREWQMARAWLHAELEQERPVRRGPDGQSPLDRG